MRLTLSAIVPRQEAVGRTRADSVLRGRAGSFLEEACGAWSPTAMALLDSVLPPCEGALGTGAALPHSCWRAVDRDVGSCWTLVTDHLVARVSVSVLIVAGRDDGLVVWAGGGQNPG